MRENAGKMRTRMTPNTDTFYAVASYAKDRLISGNFQKFPTVLEILHGLLKNMRAMMQFFLKSDDIKPDEGSIRETHQEWSKHTKNKNISDTF